MFTALANATPGTNVTVYELYTVQLNPRAETTHAHMKPHTRDQT
jgi:hypothetical protein